MPGPAFLEGETVSLHTLEPDDADFVAEHKNDIRVWRPVGWPKPEPQAEVEDWIEGLNESEDSVHLIVGVDGSPVGKVDLFDVDKTNGTAKLGYWIAPAEQESGYGAEAVSLFVDYAFGELRLHRIAAGIFGFNDASMALVESLGFTHEGAYREAIYADGTYYDLHWYGILESEWDGGED